MLYKKRITAVNYRMRET